jgi:hypothetical protein
VSHRADRIVSLAHGFIDLNWKMGIAESGRGTDHPSARKLLAVDLASHSVKPRSPRFPGTILQRDRWDSYSDHHVSTYPCKLVCIASDFLLSIPLIRRHLASHDNQRPYRNIGMSLYCFSSSVNKLHPI